MVDPTARQSRRASNHPIISTNKKHLSYAAILALTANTMNGPGITTLPDVAADAGLLLYATLIAVSVSMAAFVCRRMVYAMWSTVNDDVPVAGYGATTDTDVEGNDETESLVIAAAGSSTQTTQPVLEQTSIVGQSREAYGEKASVYVALTMVASSLALGLAQMMLCAAILDGMFVAVGGKSCALGLPTDSNPSFVHCTSIASMKPYMGSGAPMSIISVGWAIAFSASVAMGTVDLDEMMSMQFFLFGCLVVSAVRFSFVLSGMASGLEDPTTEGAADGEGDTDGGGAVNWLVGPNPFSTVGPIMFNFAFVVTAPPSSCMAKKEKIAYGALGMSCVVMGVLYIMIGLSGASVSNAVRNGMIEGGEDSNMLSMILLSGGKEGPSMFDLCIIGLFGFSTVASIPVYCLLAKETLIFDAGVAPLPAFLLSNVLPWIIVALTYNASFFEAFVNWSGLLILGYANFSIPLLLDLKLIKARALTAISKGIPKIHDDGKTSAVTKGVFILVTASITMVIVMSIFNSLTLSMVSFVAVAGLMVTVQV